MRFSEAKGAAHIRCINCDTAAGLSFYRFLIRWKMIVEPCRDAAKQGKSMYHDGAAQKRINHFLAEHGSEIAGGVARDSDRRIRRSENFVSRLQKRIAKEHDRRSQKNSGKNHLHKPYSPTFFGRGLARVPRQKNK